MLCFKKVALFWAKLTLKFGWPIFLAFCIFWAATRSSGAAGSACAEGLRQDGFTGRLVMVCAENNLPYDRPKLSKNLASTPDSIALRSAEYYEVGS